MEYIEAKIDLFKAPDHYVFAHCISRDAVMGAGIAKEFVKRFPEVKAFQGDKIHHSVYVKPTGRVYNLITKEKYWHKPTLDSLTETLVVLRKMMLQNSQRYLAIPKLGCGLDKLNWSEVSESIKEVFKHTNIKIVVCYL